MFTPPLWSRFAIVLSLLAAPSTSASATLQGCPASCPASGSSAQTGSACAVVVSEVLNLTDGRAGTVCSPSCSTCLAVVRFTWDLSGCLDEIEVGWSQQSYGTDGEALPLAEGDSNGSGSVRQGVTTSCSGTPAPFVLNVGGLEQRYTLNCGCGV